MKIELVVKSRLVYARIYHGLTQEQLAKISGTTRYTISAIENNKYNPSLKLALIICAALDLRVEDLFYLEVVKE